MNWADLRILLAAARAQTMTEAARAVGLDQTTVSRRLEQLEDAVGSPLLVRDRKGMQLTPAGERLMRAAEQMETLVVDAERDIVGKDQALEGLLRVTLPDMLAQNHADLFAEFSNRYPGVRLDLSIGYAQRSLVRREADVALRFTKKPEAQLFGRKLVRFAYAPYATQRLVNTIGPRAPMDRLPWLAWDPTLGARGTERWLRKHVPRARIVARFDAGPALHAAVEAGLGAAIMPCVYGDSAGLVRLKPPFPELGYDLWALTHEDLRRTARVRAFLEHAATYVNKRRTEIEGRRKTRRS